MIFAIRKLSIRDYIMAIAIFVNGAKGHSALQMSRDLDVEYKTAFVLSHKIRESLAAEKADATVAGEVTVDGAFFGGYVKPTNYAENRRDRRLAVNQSGKRRVVVIAREKGGKTISMVFKAEHAALETLGRRIEIGSTVHAHAASHWHRLHC